MSRLCVDLVGETIAVLAPDAEFALIETALRDLIVDEPVGPIRQIELAAGDGGFTLLDEGEVVQEGIAAGLEAATVVWWLNQIVPDSPHLVIHAGGVAGAGGVILPGRSGAGKSTLTAACLRAGLHYLSDELTILDLESGRLLAYPKPISLGHEELTAASAMQPGSVVTDVRLSGVIFPRFEPGASLSVTDVDPTWVLLALTSHSTNLARTGSKALPWLASIAEHCSAWQVDHGNADDVVPLVHEAAGTEPPVLEPASLIGPITDDTTTVALGEDLAVYHEASGRTHVLTQAAAFAWASAAGTTDPTERIERVLDRAPQGSIERQAVIATVDQLVAIGLLDPGSS